MRFHRNLKTNKLGWSIVLLFVILFLAGCAANGQDGDNESAGDASPSEETRAVEHAMGETDVPVDPKRIVVLTNEGTEALLALGIKPVGAVKSWTGDPWYDHIADQMEGVTVVGTESQPEIETIAALEPDLIIGNKMRQEAVYEHLDSIAPTVFSEELRGEWQHNFQQYADAVNRVEKGREILNEFDATVQDIREKAGDKLDQEVSIVRFMAGDTRIYHKDSFSGIILDNIGFARPESQDVDDFAAKNITKERIPEMDGDIIFYFTYETGDGEATAVEEDWTKDPLWNTLNAVEAGNVHKVSDVIWNTSGGVLAANQMLEDLYRYFELDK